MKQKSTLILLFLLIANSLFAQNSFIGIQNSQRKSMHSVGMNPAEINNLTRKFELNIFSIQGSLSNNILSFQDVLNESDDLLNFVFQNADGPVNIRTSVEIMGPSIGIRFKKWSFGFTTQTFNNAHLVDFDPKLGESLTIEQLSATNNIFTINSPYNQRININGWTELGFTGGIELLELGNHKLSIGGTFKLLFPYNYVNIGLDNINGTLVQDDSDFFLSNSTGAVNITYPEMILDEDNLTFSLSPFNFTSLNGIGFDLGANYQLKDEKGTKLNAGITLRNFGGMTFGQNQRNTTYRMNIPQNEFFELNFEGNLEEVESRLTESGYFTIDRQREGIRSSLPTLIAAYGELKVTPIFYLSLYGQQNFSDMNRNEQVVNQNLLVITPRLLLGNFEIYSPWVNYEVAGITGGLGLRVGGFFIGSNSVLTGLIADTNQIDVHFGFSVGFGNR